MRCWGALLLILRVSHVLRALRVSCACYVCPSRVTRVACALRMLPVSCYVRLRLEGVTCVLRVSCALLRC